MSAAAAAVLSQARLLSPEDCEELYLLLGEHLYGSAENGDLSGSAKTTLERRWDEIASGKVRGVDPMVALQEARAKYHV